MNTEILGVVFMFVATILIAVPLGRYIGKVYSGHDTWLDSFLHPVDLAHDQCHAGTAENHLHPAIAG